MGDVGKNGLLAKDQDAAIQAGLPRTPSAWQLFAPPVIHFKSQKIKNDYNAASIVTIYLCYPIFLLIEIFVRFVTIVDCQG
jgi:hypothetical protein